MQVNNPIPKEFEHDKAALSGKNILITGAASDLGNSLCRGLARAGAIVLMMDRREKNMTNLYDDLVAEGCAEPMIVALDHTKSTDQHMDTLAGGLSQQITALNGLVHLPLTAAPLTPFTLTKTETWIQTWNLLFLQPMLLTRALIPLLDKSGDGSVVFSTLDSGRLGKAYWGIPGAAYAAIENLSQSLSHEYQDIRFNTLEPGKVNTALRHKYYPAEAKSELRSFDDSYLIDHFTYLLSSRAKNLTGQQLKVPDLV